MKIDLKGLERRYAILVSDCRGSISYHEKCILQYETDNMLSDYVTHCKDMILEKKNMLICMHYLLYGTFPAE